MHTLHYDLTEYSFFDFSFLRIHFPLLNTSFLYIHFLRIHRNVFKTHELFLSYMLLFTAAPAAAASLHKTVSKLLLNFPSPPIFRIQHDFGKNSFYFHAIHSIHIWNTQVLTISCVCCTSTSICTVCLHWIAITGIFTLLFFVCVSTNDSYIQYWMYI